MRRSNKEVALPLPATKREVAKVCVWALLFSFAVAGAAAGITALFIKFPIVGNLIFKLADFVLTSIA